MRRNYESNVITTLSYFIIVDYSYIRSIYSSKYTYSCSLKTLHNILLFNRRRLKQSYLLATKSDMANSGHELARPIQHRSTERPNGVATEDVVQYASLAYSQLVYIRS